MAKFTENALEEKGPREASAPGDRQPPCNDRLRKAYRDYWRSYGDAICDQDSESYKEYPPYPKVFLGLMCGAKTRAGSPCKRTDLYSGGRCKFHGGLSTGPKTKKGKAKAAKNGKLGGRGRRGKPKPMNG